MTFTRSFHISTQPEQVDQTMFLHVIGYWGSMRNPVATILNASFREQKLPRAWKLADVTPLPKTKPVKEIKKKLRPISLTPSISKITEEFVGHVKPAVLRILNPSHFGAIPKSSTTFALLEMVHEWSRGTDGNGSTIRSLVWLQKAFDLIVF